MHHRIPAEFATCGMGVWRVNGVVQTRDMGVRSRGRQSLTPIILNYLLPVRAHTSYGVYGAPGHRLPLTCNVTAPRGRVRCGWRLRCGPMAVPWADDQWTTYERRSLGRTLLGAQTLGAWVDDLSP